MIKIKVDGKEIEVPRSFTLLQAAEAAGAVVPRFCFHDRLSIAGNCRMCLVEVKGGPPKPQASCAMNVSDLRAGPEGKPPEIFTNSAMAKKARRGALEFLLINHPLDCPICDQGGECDLQDQAMAYGRVSSRYRETKRAVEDKYLGPLIKTNMTRCIHCTRCVRFTTEIAGILDLGLLGRGEDAEIASYLEKALVSELQGNVVDLCPVGALTSRPYAFRARPWELQKVESVDVMDAMGSAIRVDVRGNEVLRILPALNEDINQEWISDKTRYVVDGLRANRIDTPYLRVNNKLVPVSWQEAFQAIKNTIASVNLSTARIGAIAGALAGVEEMFVTKEMLKYLGSDAVDCRQKNTFADPKYGRASYIFNSSISAIHEADAILIIGSNPKIEAPVLNSYILKNYRNNNIPIGVIGENVTLSYPYTFLGFGASAIDDLIDGSNSFIQKLKAAQKPLIIVGQGVFESGAGLNIMSAIAKLALDTKAIKEDWAGVSILQTEASCVGGFDIGFVSSNSNAQEIVDSSDVLFLLGADEIDFSNKKAFTIYIGTHGDYSANYADVILPGSTYIEKSAIYVNTEGRPQITNKVIFAPGQAKEDWSIILALCEVLGIKLPYDNLWHIREEIFKRYPHLAKIGDLTPANMNDIAKLANNYKPLEKHNLKSTLEDFYLSNAIARSSSTMAECSVFYRDLQATTLKSRLQKS